MRISAPDRRHLLHGVGRSLRHRGHSRRRWLRPRHRHSAGAAVLWSLPTALMIGELASAIPAEGGFYVWVRRALGPFWGYQEGWLSLSASIFDMAIYPAIFVLYLGKFNPALTAGLARLCLVACCRRRLLRLESSRRARGRRRFGVACLLCCSRPSRSSWPSASGTASRCTRPCTGAGPHARSSALSRRPSSSPCGITWAGTMPPPSRRKWRIRSATIPAP